VRENRFKIFDRNIILYFNKNTLKKQAFLLERTVFRVLDPLNLAKIITKQSLHCTMITSLSHRVIRSHSYSVQINYLSKKAFKIATASHIHYLKESLPFSVTAFFTAHDIQQSSFLRKFYHDLTRRIKFAQKTYLNCKKIFFTI
jgi:hypothetical protein